MPDISMCNNSKCPSCNRCYRFTATPSDFYQTYGVFNVEEGKEKCEYFWEDVDSSERLLKLINRAADKDSLRELKKHVQLQDDDELLNKYYSKLLTFGTFRGEYKEEAVYYDLDYVTHNRSMFIANDPNEDTLSSEITNSNFWEKAPFYDYEAEYNAKLIACAPEMLALLIDIIEDRETFSDLFPSYQQKIEKIIKKATEL